MEVLAQMSTIFYRNKFASQAFCEIDRKTIGNVGVVNPIKDI